MLTSIVNSEWSGVTWTLITTDSDNSNITGKPGEMRVESGGIAGERLGKSEWKADQAGN